MRKKIVLVGISVGIIIIGLLFNMTSVKEQSESSVRVIGGADGPTSVYIAGKVDPTEKNTEMYVSISMEEAQEIFQNNSNYVVVDVRRADEYMQGHIPGAINIANEEIGNKPLEQLPDKNQMIYVYCRSGNRSKQAAAKLVALGYHNIVEFGGIIDWKGEIEIK